MKDNRYSKGIHCGLGFIMRCYYNTKTKHIFIQSQIRKLKSKEEIRKNNRDQIKKAKIVMTKLKINGCAICGYNECQSSLVFHHTNPKNKKHILDYATLRCKDETVINELNKCILLCANCHGKIHELERASSL